MVGRRLENRCERDRVATTDWCAQFSLRPSLSLSPDLELLTFVPRTSHSAILRSPAALAHETEGAHEMDRWVEREIEEKEREWISLFFSQQLHTSFQSPPRYERMCTRLAPMCLFACWLQQQPAAQAVTLRWVSSPRKDGNKEWNGAPGRRKKGNISLLRWCPWIIESDPWYLCPLFLRPHLFHNPNF